MGAIRAVTGEFIRLVRREVHANAVLVVADDVFEVENVPIAGAAGRGGRAEPLLRAAQGLLLFRHHVDDRWLSHTS